MRFIHAAIAATAAMLLALCACGGGSSGGGPNPGPATQSPAGIWTGRFTSARNGATLNVRGACSAAGSFRYFGDDDSIGVGQLSVTGSSMTGTGIVYSSTGTTSALTISNGQVTTGSSITGQWSVTGDNGTMSFTFDALYNRPVSIASMAGSYYADATNTTSGSEAWITVAADGRFTGRDDSGYFSGTFSALDSSRNLFSVSLTYEGYSTVYSGLGFWSDGQSANFRPSSIYSLVSNPSGTDQFGAGLGRAAAAFSSFDVRNQTSYSITELYIALHTSPYWGSNQLVAPIPVGGSRTFGNWPAGVYDVRARLSNGSYRYGYSFNVGAGTTFTVNVLN